MSLLLPKPGPFFLRLAVLIGIMPLIGWLGGSFWVLDLFNHFQIQYAVLIGICVIGLLWVKAFRLAGIAAVILLIPMARLFPLFIGPMQKPIGTPIRVANFNVLTANTRYADAVKWIRETDPDVIFLPEVDEVWADALSPLKETHPHFIEHIVEGNFGFALYSKLPILKQQIIPCGQLDLPLLKATLQGPNGEFTFFGAHPVPPITGFWASERDIFLQRIAEETAKETAPVILAGDLNASRWSHAMKPLFDAGLQDSACGHGPSATWLRNIPVVAIPIDHLLYRGAADKPGLANCRKRWTGPDLGSDHRPVVAEIGW